MCHAAEPVWDGLHYPPKGVMLETDYQIIQHARSIFLHAGVSTAMPPANLSYITQEERDALSTWYRDISYEQ
jgi:uncharacterized membrane protein